MTGIKLNVDAHIDTVGLDAQVAAIAKEFNAIGSAIAKANNVKFSPVNSATLADVKKLTDNYKEMLKLQSGLRERMKATGQGASPFEGLDFDRMYSDPAQAHRARTNAYRRVTHGTPFGIGTLESVPLAGSGSSGSLAPIAPPRDERWNQTISGRIIGSGLRGAGPAGGVVAGAIDNGMANGIGAGIGGLLGGLAALGVGKAVSGIMNKVGDAQQEAIGVDTLKRSLGDVGIDFIALREKVRAVADGMGLTFAETHKVAAEFARLTGEMKPAALANAIGFGRGFGVDPSASAQFFGRMQQSASDEGDRKRLALNIAEAIGRAGVFTKTDEVLHAVASFAEQTASNSLTRGNTDSFLGALTGLAGSRLPDMTPGTAAALLGRANAAIQNGGAAGEAGQNFMYRALNADRKLSPFEVKLMQEGGLFATRSGVLGVHSLYSQSIGRSFEGSGTVFDAIRSQLGANYQDKRLRLMALSNLTGINASQAMAMDQFVGRHGEGNVGKLANFLKDKGIDLGKVNEGGMASLGAIFGGSRAMLNDQAQSLLDRSGANALSDDDRKKLNGALEGGGSDEKLRDMLLVLTATHDQEQTEGSETRKSLAELTNATQRMATPLVGPINTMRDALVLMAGAGKMGSNTIAEKVKEIERHEILNKYSDKARISAAGFDARIGALKAEKDRHSTTPLNALSAPALYASIKAKEAAINAQISVLEGQKASEQAKIENEKNSKLGAFENGSGDLFSGISASRRKIMEEAAIAQGVDPNAMAAVLKLEHSGANAVSPKGARGEFQLMPDNVPKGSDPRDFATGAAGAAAVLRDASRRYPGNIRAQIAYYNGGKAAGDAIAGGGEAPTAEGRNYVKRFDAMLAGTPMPDGVSAKTNSGGAQDVNVHVTADALDIKVNQIIAAQAKLNATAGPARPQGNRK